jgi:transcription elongation GreA/GreB family factor
MMQNAQATRKRRIALTQSDLSKLRSVVETAKRYLRRSYIEMLAEKLDDAEVVNSDKVPKDLVEMETSVCITDLDRSERKICKLVFPRDADYGNRISVIAPLGAALFGSRVGDVIEIDAPERKRRVRVDRILNTENDVAA